MNKHLLLGSCALWFCFHQASADDAVTSLQPNLAKIQVHAHSQTAYDTVASLTTEVGPRLAGSEGDAKAVAWAQRTLKSLGFDKVWIEPVTVKRWVRHQEEAQVISPFTQKLHVVALGGSVATPKEGIEASIVHFENVDALKKASSESIKNKIVFISQPTERTRDGSGYGKAVVMRIEGAPEAAKRGAIALLIRSVGTDHHRLAHTGMMMYDDKIQKIPAAALSTPDADMLVRQLSYGKPVTVKLLLDTHNGFDATSANVIAEIKGRELPEQIVLLGAHLDSWDLGTGAIDDGAGVAIVTAAAHAISKLPQRPKRTLRVVLYANEEFGLVGAEAYAKKHAKDLHRIKLAMEADFGAGKVWEFATRVPEQQLAKMKIIANTLAPLGITQGDNQAHGGPDLQPLMKLGVPVVTLHQDGTDYFDYHHTANDTLDKINPETLKQATTAFATTAYLAAELE